MREADHSDRRRLRPRFGIGTRLTLGLAAVAVVVLGAHVLATRTTRAAVAAVRSMRTRQEPLAHRASVILERLSAYDRTVTLYEYHFGTPPHGVWRPDDAMSCSRKNCKPQRCR